jgi:ligand-binding SRPBCC domain-containing protein
LVRIECSTAIAAPIGRCFDLSRSIDLHMASTDGTGERAIAGVTSGLIGPGQEVKWRGRHFGLAITHSSKITAYERPGYFRDSMVYGWFERFCHDHYFEAHEGSTLMRDVMEFDAPFGPLGRVAEQFLLERHMRRVLAQRNSYIKRVAESEDYRRYVQS